MKTCQFLGGVVLALAGGTTLAWSQSAPIDHIDVPYTQDTGWVSNHGRAGDVIASFTVSVPGTDWLRLYFEQAELPRGSEVRITSWMDADVQVLNGQTMDQWGLSSAYLNGDTVQVDVYAEPGTAPARLVLREVDAGIHVPEESICGPTDDRQPSSDQRVARVLPVGCTGWLIDDCGGCFLTAGHCDGGLSVAQFNVPLSTAGGGLVNPPAADQYPIDPASVQSNGGLGIGNDWAVFGCFPNSNTSLTAVQAQGSTFVLANSIPSTTGQTIRITGHGTDSSPLTWNQIQQTHTGPFVDNSGTRVGYVTDTTGGNSGSPVIHEQTGQAIGIHTHGGCNSTGGNNWGTQITHASLQAAINNPQGVCASACVTCNSDAFGNNHTCATAASVGNGIYAAEVCKTEPDFFAFSVAAGATVDITILNDSSVADVDAMLYEAVNCSDDQTSACTATLDCGYTSSDNEVLTWTNNTGSNMDCILRVHVWPSSAGDSGPYTLDLSGTGCSAVADVFENNDTCATAVALTDGTYPGLTTDITDMDMYSFTVAAGATVDVSVLYSVAEADIDAFLFTTGTCDDTTPDPGCAPTLACGWTSTDDEIFSWTNTGVTDVDCVLRVSVWPNSAGDCGNYDLMLSGTGAGSPITYYCNPANANSTGAPCQMTGTMSGGLHLDANSGPVGQFGYFLVSASPSAGAPVSQGLLCITGNIGRYNALAGPALDSIGQFQGAGGTFFALNQGTVGFDVPNSLPSPPGGVIAPGSTWFFQLWYRDGIFSNFSNAAQVTF